MLRKKAFPLVLAFAAVIVFAGGLSLGPSPRGVSATELDAASEACTVIMVGREASTDGSVMSTHAADCGVCDFTWRHVPAADHKPAEKRRLYNIDQIRTWPPSEGGKWAMVLKDPTAVEIPQAPHTYGYHHAVFGYMNDQQLAIAESTIGPPRPRPPTSPC
jgi:dipeptidase